MKYARLGRSGLTVSRIGFGAMTFGKAPGPMSHVFKADQRAADAMVGMALDQAVTLFGTADVYADGQSERMLGKALKGRRESVVLASEAGLRRDQWMKGIASCFAGMRRFRVGGRAPRPLLAKTLAACSGVLAISTTFMSPAELAKYGAQDDVAARLAYFFDDWTAKEAYIKAVGGPVRFSPESITVQAEPRLNIWHDALAGNFRLALVWMDRRDNAGGPC
jgi:hypothetical protein